MSIIKRLRRGFEKLQAILLAGIGIALGLIMVVVLLQTFTRVAIFYSLPWSEELSRYLFVFIIMVGLNIAIKENILIRIDLIDYIAKGMPKKILEIIRLLIALFLCLLISISSTDLFQVGMIQKSPAMRIPMVIMYSIVFIGFLIAFMTIVFQIIDFWEEGIK